MVESLLPFCECGCGLRVTKPGNRFIYKHGRRGKKHTNKTKEKMSEAAKGVPDSDEVRIAKLKEKEPLPDNWEFDKNNKMVTNKNCPTHLGCYIAEQVLTKTFKNVKIMPHNNHGFDVICDKDYKIDIKSAATGDKRSSWMFTLDQNKIADYFLCIAFDNRDDLNIEHLWLILGKDVNYRITISISKSTLSKWFKYEQPLDEVIACCNEMKGDK